MPKQVWQTEDGNIFQSEQEAVNWEDHVKHVDDIAQYLYNSTVGLYVNDCNEAARVLLEKYTVTLK
jgi:hypothetical protein